MFPVRFQTCFDYQSTFSRLHEVVYTNSEIDIFLKIDDVRQNMVEINGDRKYQLLGGLAYMCTLLRWNNCRFWVICTEEIQKHKYIDPLKSVGSFCRKSLVPKINFITFIYYNLTLYTTRNQRWFLLLITELEFLPESTLLLPSTR